jgi:PAS domain S-box-containing protein
VNVRALHAAVHRWSSLSRYLIAVLLTLLALSLAVAGERAWGLAPTDSFLLGSVMLSAWISGLGPGIVATILGTAAADYLLVPPIHTISMDVPKIVQLSAFAAIAVLISSLNHSRRRAVAMLAAERSQLEHHVAARTIELSDANEHLRAEVASRHRSERNFRGLIDAAPDAIVVIDDHGLITKVNAEAERLFGCTREEMVGRDVELIVPERFRAAHRTKRVTYRDAASPRTIGGDLTALRADGTEFPIEIRVRPLEMQNGQAVVGIVRDVTERRHAEAVQQQLVHDLGERVKELTALHATGRLLNESRAPAQVLAQVVASLPAAWQYPDIAAARITVGDIDVRTEGFAPTPWCQRAGFQTSDNAQGVIEVVYREARRECDEGPFLAEERSLIESLAGMLRAYFERLHAEQDHIDLARAEEARIREHQANQAKDQFLATLSHELRSPLNVMMGWTQMLRSSQLDAASMARGFDVLDRSVRVQSQLIEDLLDVSRIVAGKLRLERRTVDLARIAGLAVDAARPAADARHISLRAEIAPSLLMHADPQRLQQVITNLLNNALKFTPEHGTIHVGINAADDHAQIVVRDSGSGISPDLLPRIFDRFQQGDSSTTRPHRGLGLGLAIVKHLVEEHGGRIEAASEGRGRGATFTMTLPLLADRDEAVEPLVSGRLNPSLLAGVRVLVVDDEADARVTLAAMLEQCGAHPTVVASAREAFDEIDRLPPDVLLSDVAMAEEDGISLIRRVRSTVAAARLPAAALSAYADPDSKATALDAGFQVYLAKPIEPPVLAHTLAALINRNEDRRRHSPER